MDKEFEKTLKWLKFSEIGSSVERRKVIGYGHGSNKIVRHRVDVMRVSDSIYLGAKKDEGGLTAPLYLFLDGVPDGIKLFGVGLDEDVDMCIQNYIRGHYDTRENVIAVLRRSMEKNKFIGDLTAEFVRQFSPEMAEELLQYQFGYLVRQEEKAKQMQEQAEQERLEREKQRQEEDLAERAKLLGWADGMSPMRFGRVMATLDKVTRVNGIATRKYEFVINAVRDGWMPEKKDGVVSYYGSRWDVKESKPRTVYRLAKESLFYEINKTEYDFAVFLHQEETKTDEENS